MIAHIATVADEMADRVKSNSERLMTRERGE